MTPLDRSLDLIRQIAHALEKGLWAREGDLIDLYNALDEHFDNEQGEKECTISEAVS